MLNSIVRIVSCYFVAVLVAASLLTAAQGGTLFLDPEVQALVTLIVGSLHALARRMGGST
jgi:hypothetical protein